MQLLSIFETLDQKLEVLLSIFCGTKITLEWITHPPPFLDLPIFRSPINTQFFSTPLPNIQYFEIPIPHPPPLPFVTGRFKLCYEAHFCFNLSILRSTLSHIFNLLKIRGLLDRLKKTFKFITNCKT